jgi:hypothetical protein
MLAAVKKYVQEGWKNLDEKDMDAPWEKSFGSSYIRQMALTLRDAGVSEDGQASAIIGLIWAYDDSYSLYLR